MSGALTRIVFIDAGGKRRDVTSAAEISLMQAAKNAGIDMEGACEGCMACSTCHVIVEPDWAARLPKPQEAEQDMLDLTYGVKPNSRLACQITLTPALDGLVVRLPEATRNMME
ncbi:MAG: 2Fe-2S iron-sulfur cluster-binding protein [Rhodospirillaceae bacterium]|nr:2Fe-2S iron-sulfur cluster-binding protein [Rhodospirillaceae bacterium]